MAIIQIPVFSGDDATDHIQHTIDRLSPGDTLVVPAGKDYPIDAVKGLYLRSGLTLQVDGMLTALPNSQPGYAVVCIYDVQDVVICGNGTIRGERWRHNGQAGEWGHCIEILRSQNVLIKEVKLRDAWGDGIAIDHNDGNDMSNAPKNVRISGVQFLSCRRQGLSVMVIDILKVTGCLFQDIGGTEPGCGIDMETDAPYKYIKNAIIEGNIFKNTAGSNISVGFEVGDYHYIIVRNNTHDLRSQPIYVTGNAGKLGEPIWAWVLKNLFGKQSSYRWWGYPLSWNKT